MKRRRLPLFAGFGLLIVMLVAGFVWLNGGRQDAPEETAAPTLAVAITEVPAGEDVTVAAGAPAFPPGQPAPAQETATEVAGTLRFAEPDANNLRPYTLQLEGVPAPPAGFHYELWFEISGQSRPENVAVITAQDGQIVYTDLLVENLAAGLTGAFVSLEPDFDDDPTISADIVYSGTLNAAAGLAEIEMFPTGP
jgi:hypothetical protein